MKIGILYICTGKYEIFWKDFYLSCEKYFIPEAEKDYYVFTDAPHIEDEEKNQHIHKIYQENLGWPENTLARYAMFAKIIPDLEKYDFIFFFNANALFITEISATEFLPSGNQTLVGALHPGFYHSPKNKLPFEQNPQSTAYLVATPESNYYQGAINGGIGKDFIRVIQTLKNNIEIDKKNTIIAKWHDESHWNKYLAGRNDVKVLLPSYLYPDGLHLPFEIKILMQDKNKFGGHDFIRGERTTPVKKIKKIISKIIHRQ